MAHKKRRRTAGGTLGKVLKISVLIGFIVVLLGVGTLGIATIHIVQNAPTISTDNMNSMLTENSVIVDANGETLEMIQTEEFRRIISIDEIPQTFIEAVIATEDESFYTNIGVDPQGIVMSAVDNFVAGGIVRGGSTITQQVAKLIYLSDEQTIQRKLMEAYIAIQLTDQLPKDQILEAYLNRIFLGQGAYGIEAAAQIYFSKNASDLTLAESAALASVINSPSNNALYKTISPAAVEPEDRIVGEVMIENQRYVAVYNAEQEERVEYVLNRMLDQGYITEQEKEDALNYDLFAALNPPERKTEQVSSYFTDFVKDQVVQKLMDQLGYSEEEATDKLYNGGLVITATIDLEKQEKLDTLYDEFTEALLGDVTGWNEPAFIKWRLSEGENILNQNGNLMFFKKENLLSENNEVYFSPDTYTLDENGLTINSEKVYVRESFIDFMDFYTRSEENNLMTHQVSGIEFGEDYYTANEDGSFTVSQEFLDQNPDFYRTNDSGYLFISPNYFYFDEVGVLQPQVTTVLMDHHNGHILAMRGGRGTTGSSVLNRATQSPRHPGSTMKPIATYLPALDNGYTAATPIDDVPYFDETGRRWPMNWDLRYEGIVSLRRSIIASKNVNAVKTLEDVGIGKSKSYLEKLHLIDPEHPERDNFVSRDEDPAVNDENLAAMGLGGMVNGFTNLEMTGAYSAIANDGTYIEPISFTKIEDTQGRLILDNQPETTEVVSAQTAFIMKDILRDLTNSQVIRPVQIDGIATAGKTGTSGTTEYNTDSWFVGFTPYMSAAVWIGNDNPNIFIDEVSSYAVRFWGMIMRDMHEGYEDKQFDVPEGIVEAEVCTQSGKKPTSLCYQDPRGTVITEYFVKGTEPVEDCDAHVLARVDRTSGLLASDNCSSGNIVSRVFVKRPQLYVSSENENILPDDWSYTLPTQYCTSHTVPRTEETEEPETSETEEPETSETEAPVTEAPVTEATETEPPVTEPPVTEPPVTEPPVTEPPVTEPPETEAP